MEPLEAEAVAGVSFLDDLLLDFSPDGFTEDNPCRNHQTPVSHHHSSAIQPPTPSEEEHSRASLVDDEFFELDSFPALEVEEELEWLSNKEAFPTLDTFDIPFAASPPNPKCPSAVSVLECVSGGGIGEGLLPVQVPVRARSKGRRKRRAFCVLGFTAAAAAAAAAAEPSRERQRCLHCEAEETPQWRAGPYGPKTLCNACGVRYKSGRLVAEYRPANSPSFSGALHSNSHRKIVEMRRMKDGAAAAETVARKKKRAYLIL